MLQEAVVPLSRLQCVCVCLQFHVQAAIRQVHMLMCAVVNLTSLQQLGGGCGCVNFAGCTCWSRPGPAGAMLAVCMSHVRALLACKLSVPGQLCCGYMRALWPGSLPHMGPDAIFCLCGDAAPCALCWCPGRAPAGKAHALVWRYGRHSCSVNLSS